MKEMTNNHAIHLGGSVKKTLFVVAVAAILVLSVAGSAFAVNHSGQQRMGNSFSTGAPVGGGGINPTNNVNGAGSFTYQDWSTGIGNIASTNGVSGVGGNATENSPHGDYTTNTVKCAVCHAVHYAAAGGPVNGTQTADTLLRVRADQACAYCHATAGQSVNGRPVYDGVFPASSGGSTTVGHATNGDCSECHTGPHGAGADNSVAGLSGYLLKNQTNTFGAGATVTTNMLSAMTALETQATGQGFAAGAVLGDTPANFATTNDTAHREQAVGIFCAECHNGSYAQVAAGGSANVSGNTGTQLTTAAGAGLGAAMSGHRIAAAATSTWQSASGQVSSSKMTGVAVAWAPATNCKSCHDSQDVFGNNAFPHSWGQDAAGNKTRMWLLQASNAGATKTALPQNNASPSSYGIGKGQAELYDGVCLKCHVAGTGTSGVGLTF
jgi:hypothetical protein